MSFRDVSGKTLFSTDGYFSEYMDIRTDYVLISGLDDTTYQRCKSWRDNGYNVGVSIGLSYGNYNDYLNGKWDEENHWDDVQMDESETYVLRGPNVPYLVPTENFTRYLYEKTRPLIDKGINLIVLKNPIYWSVSGYSNSFKREWEIFYNKPWAPVNENPTMIYKASKLKSDLLLRCIYYLSSTLKYYAKSKHKRDISVFVSTNGLINSSYFSAISPVCEMIKLRPIDGLIADIDVYSELDSVSDQGTTSEMFSFANMEYNIMREAVNFSDKKMFFAVKSTDNHIIKPVAEYKANFEKVLVSSLLNSLDFGYKIPSKYLFESMKDESFNAKDFSSFFVCLNALKNIGMEKVRREDDEDNNVGIFLSDTLMYQRLYPSQDQYQYAYSDDIENFSFIRGLSVPLLRKGINVNYLFIERVKNDYELLNDYNVLLLSYEFMKPISPDFHYALLAWVKSGGVLVYVGNDSDSFNNIDEWWQMVRDPYPSPAMHLFDVMGVSSKVETLKRKNKRMSSLQRPVSDSIFDVGKGIFAVMPEHPSLFAREESYAHLFRKLILTAAERKSIYFRRKNYFVVNRGPYKIISVLEDSNYPYSAEGAFIDLFDDKMEVSDSIKIPANTQKIFYNIDAKIDDDIDILTIGAVVDDFSEDSYGISFTAKLPEGISSGCRIYLPYSCEIKVNGTPVKFSRDKSGKTVFFRIDGAAEAMRITARRTK